MANGTYETVVATEKADAALRAARTPHENWIADRRMSLRKAIRDLERAEYELARGTNRGVQDCVRFIGQAQREITDATIKATSHCFVAADDMQAAVRAGE